MIDTAIQPGTKSLAMRAFLGAPLIRASAALGFAALSFSVYRPHSMLDRAVAASLVCLFAVGIGITAYWLYVMFARSFVSQRLKNRLGERTGPIQFLIAQKMAMRMDQRARLSRKRFVWMLAISAACAYQAWLEYLPNMLLIALIGITLECVWTYRLVTSEGEIVQGTL